MEGLDSIIEEAISDFAKAEAQKMGIDVDRVSVNIKFEKDGKPYYGILIDGRWNPEAGSRKFAIGEIINQLG